MARLIVEVMLKPEIHDPQGDAIASACRRLGFGQVLGVRQGKRFEVEVDGPADEDAVTAQILALFEAGATDVWAAPFAVGDARASRARTRALLAALARA